MRHPRAYRCHAHRGPRAHRLQRRPDAPAVRPDVQPRAQPAGLRLRPLPGLSRRDGLSARPVVIRHASSGGVVHVLTHDGLVGTIDPGEVSAPDLLSLMSGLVTRSLTQYRYDPQSKQMVLVPDLATDLGRHNDDYTKWILTVRPGVTYEDGTKVRPEDVARGILRCFHGRWFRTSPCQGLRRHPGLSPRREARAARRPDPSVPRAPVGGGLPGVRPRTTCGGHGPCGVRTAPVVDRSLRGLSLPTRPPADVGPEPAVGRAHRPGSDAVPRRVRRARRAVVRADRGRAGHRLRRGADDVDLRQRSGGLASRNRLARGPGPCTTYLAPDNRTISDPRVRRALLWAYPYRAMLRIEGLTPGVTAIPATNVLPPGVPGRTPLLVRGHPAFATQPAVARRMLARARAGHRAALQLDPW
jgi:peptide/nickel transport system substrate-binding protein